MTGQESLERLLRIYYYMCKTGKKRVEFNKLKAEIVESMK